MKLKKYIILLFIIMISIITNISYSMVALVIFNVISFKNVNSESNLYILYNKNEEYDINNNLKKELADIDKNIIDIQAQIKKQKFSKGLEKDDNDIIINDKKYGKIKIVKDLYIAYQDTENIIFARIVNNQVEIIDMGELVSYDSHKDGSENFYACEYDANEMSLNDITENMLDIKSRNWDEQEQKKERKEKIISYFVRIGMVILFTVFLFGAPILAGKFVDNIIMYFKNKK